MRKSLVGMVGVAVALMLAACGSVVTAASSYLVPCNSDWYYDLAWSPDGKYIAYEVIHVTTPGPDPEGHNQFVVIFPSGTVVVETDRADPGPLKLQWLPDSQTVAYLGVPDVYTFNLTGATTKIVLPEGHSGNLVFSPDGKWMAYNGGGDRVGLGIDIVRSDGTGLINLTNSLETFYQWSPDGTQLTFVDNRDFHQYVSTMRIDGSDQRHLAEGDGPVYWSPDGEWLSYVSNDDNGVHIIRADGTDDRLVIPDIYVNSYGWLPDGQHLFFVRRELKVVNLNTMVEETITTFTIDRHAYPPVVWSPDGSIVVFVGYDPSTINAPSEIYIVNRDGSGQTRLTDNPGKYQCLQWPF